VASRGAQDGEWGRNVHVYTTFPVEEVDGIEPRRLRQKKKKKKLHHSSHIRLIRRPKREHEIFWPYNRLLQHVRRGAGNTAYLNDVKNKHELSHPGAYAMWSS
jgi:hypothetical protein